MGATYYQGVGIVFSPAARTLSLPELRYIRRHVLQITGLNLTEQQARQLWVDAGRPVVLGEPGVVRIDACVRMVDVLCATLLGHDWPINGGDGLQPRDEFFHRFSSAAIEAGYDIEAPNAA